MSSRGRGFSSRGSSYRGRGGGNDWNNSMNSSRGGYSSRGRFKYNTPNYDSRSKYQTGPPDRYSSRGGRGDHSSSYKRPRDSYSGRDDHRSSADQSRKRIRTDSYQGGGSSGQRYSYGGSSTGGYEENKRSSTSYEDKRQNERSSSYHRQDERHSASRNYGSQSSIRSNDMAPPTPRYQPSRGRISQSSSFRGRGTRGTGRGFTSRLPTSSHADSILARKRSALEYRRKILGSRPRDYIQRVRMTSTKMRRSSSGTIRLPGSKKEPGTASSVKDKIAKALLAEFSDDDEDEENKSSWDEDEKPHHEVEDEEREEAAESDDKQRAAEKRKKEKLEREASEDEERIESRPEEEADSKKEVEEREVPRSLKDETREEEVKTDRERSESEEDLPSRRDGRRFIKLNCPHCSHHSVTFKEYSLHLYSGRHNAAMRRVAAKRKAELAHIRIQQRQDQKRIEARDAMRGTLPSRTMFCPICKLNYRSLKAIHQLSEAHRQIKRFLTPYCRTCRIAFRSPMLYETHICTLDHIKRKSMLDERRSRNNEEGEGEGEESTGPDDDKDVNLDNFMTLDSVGDEDEEIDDPEEKSEKKKTDGAEAGEAPKTDAEKKPKAKQTIKFGAEFIKRVEAYYCKLCECYLPSHENPDRAISLHCSTRSHLRRYVRNNDDKRLRREAERIHLQTTSTNNSTTSNAANTSLENKNASNNGELKGDDKADNSSISIENSTSEVADIAEESAQRKSSTAPTSGGEAKVNLKQPEVEDEEEYSIDNGDKLWDEVNKDIGEILREVGAESDDEDSRYDRFRNSEKLIKEKNSVDVEIAPGKESVEEKIES